MFTIYMSITHISRSFTADEEGSILMVEKEKIPTDSLKSNPAFTYNYDAGKISSIDQIIGGKTYRQTITYTGNLITNISEWQEL